MTELPDEHQEIVVSSQQKLAFPGQLIPPEEQVVEAEWVRRYPSRRLRGLFDWLLLFFKLALALALTWLFYLIPPQTFPTPFQNWKNPVIIFLLVCYIGKTLLDTFFYDHYQPR
ncbi:MAG TPA: hypothetical protein VH186_23875 [Chloroflexia bacterium]|nr:hypothetical protein [Chloroflexia bacterium]